MVFTRILSGWCAALFFSMTTGAACADFTNDIAGKLDWPKEWAVFYPLTRDDPVLAVEILKAIPERIAVAGKELQAQIVKAPNNRVDFAPLFGATNAGNTAYAFLTLESAQEQEVTLGMGADWWLQAWLNGELIMDTLPAGNLEYPPSLSDYVVNKRLKAGKNILAVRFISGSKSSILALGGPEELRRSRPIPCDQWKPANAEGALPLKPNQALLVKKVPVIDCRIGRAFVHQPVDGRLDSRAYSGLINEYPFRMYEFNDSNGLHLTLADEEGFDAVIIRGGFLGRIFRDAGAFYPGDKAVELCPVTGANELFRKIFPTRLKTSKVSFFFDGDPKKAGRFSDGSFLRVEREKPEIKRAKIVSYKVGGKVAIPEQIAPWLKARFGYNQTVLAAGERSETIALTPFQLCHVITPPQEPELGLTAVGIKFQVNEMPPESQLTLRIQDPLDARRELMGVDFIVAGKGEYEVILDMPDQVFLPPLTTNGPRPILEGEIAPPPVIWLAIASAMTAELASVELKLYKVPRDKALNEALQWRKLLLKGEFHSMSEPNPWNGEFIRKPNLREALQNTPDIKAYRSGLEELLETLEQCRMLAPEDEITRQYYECIYKLRYNAQVNKLVLPKWNLKIPEAAGAPKWAVLLHEGYLALREIPLWWLNNRLAPSGELGGGVNDDTDMNQEWSSFPFIEDKPLGETIRSAAGNLNSFIMARHMTNGLNLRTTDALHAYEEGINQVALCPFWFYGDPVYLEQAFESARNIPRLTVIGGDGRRHFHGDMVGAADLEKMGEIGKDGNFTPLLLHPIYTVGWYNRNPAAIGFLKEWSDTWGKYLTTNRWFNRIDVKTGAGVDADSVPAGSGSGYTRFQIVSRFGVYQVTGDPRHLKPFFDALDSGLPGSGNFLSRRLPLEFASAPDAKEYVEKNMKVFTNEVGGYAGYLVTGDKKLLEGPLAEALAEGQRFRHMYTAAEPYTDRVYTRNFAAIIACQLGFFTTRNFWNMYHAASYEGLCPEAVALVSLIRPDALTVTFYNFSDKEVAGKMRVWRLEHGMYRVRTGPDADDNGELDKVTDERKMELYRYEPVEVKLPPREETIVEIQQVEKLADILERADLALSPLDTRSSADGRVQAVIHNIGSKPASNVKVVLQRGGKEITAQKIAKIEPPLDLLPKTVALTFEQVKKGDELVIDPDNNLPEITKYNNRLSLH